MFATRLDVAKAFLAARADKAEANAKVVSGEVMRWPSSSGWALLLPELTSPRPRAR